MVTMMHESGRFPGLRVLLVEDNFLVATDLEWMLRELGCEVVGPVASVEEGVELATRERLDGAVLDVNITGGNSGAIARLLRSRHCPFFFVTGYASPAFDDVSFSRARRLRKPVDVLQLQDAIVAEFSTTSGNSTSRS